MAGSASQARTEALARRGGEALGGALLALSAMLFGCVVLFGKFAVRVRPDGLTATAWGERLDPTRHVLSHEVKAITYHELTVEPTPEGWQAEVIVDI